VVAAAGARPDAGGPQRPGGEDAVGHHRGDDPGLGPRRREG
jgi:hypothetical protein